LGKYHKSIVKETIDRWESKMAIGESRYVTKEVWQRKLMIDFCGDPSYTSGK
jgi:hypothetical protein